MISKFYPKLKNFDIKNLVLIPLKTPLIPFLGVLMSFASLKVNDGDSSFHFYYFSIQIIGILEPFLWKETLYYIDAKSMHKNLSNKNQNKETSKTKHNKWLLKHTKNKTVTKV